MTVVFKILEMLDTSLKNSKRYDKSQDKNGIWQKWKRGGEIMVMSAYSFCRDSQFSSQHPEVIEKQKEMNIQQTSQEREAFLYL